MTDMTSREMLDAVQRGMEKYWRHMDVENAKRRAMEVQPSPLDIVALLTPCPADKLALGQVGTIVERLAEDRWLVAFSDDQGRTFASLPCARADLLILRYAPEAP